MFSVLHGCLPEVLTELSPYPLTSYRILTSTPYPFLLTSQGKTLASLLLIFSTTVCSRLPSNFLQVLKVFSILIIFRNCHWNCSNSILIWWLLPSPISQSLQTCDPVFGFQMHWLPHTPFQLCQGLVGLLQDSVILCKLQSSSAPQYSHNHLCNC
jgi:hypothetical protein